MTSRLKDPTRFEPGQKVYVNSVSRGLYRAPAVIVSPAFFGLPAPPEQPDYIHPARHTVWHVTTLDGETFTVHNSNIFLTRGEEPNG